MAKEYDHYRDVAFKGAEKVFSELSAKAGTALEQTIQAHGAVVAAALSTTSGTPPLAELLNYSYGEDNLDSSQAFLVADETQNFNIAKTANDLVTRFLTNNGYDDIPVMLKIAEVGGNVWGLMSQFAFEKKLNYLFVLYILAYEAGCYDTFGLNRGDDQSVLGTLKEMAMNSDGSNDSGPNPFDGMADALTGDGNSP